jgi:hypothetical protein
MTWQLKPLSSSQQKKTDTRCGVGWIEREREWDRRIEEGEGEHQREEPHLELYDSVYTILTFCLTWQPSPRWILTSLWSCVKRSCNLDQAHLPPLEWILPSHFFTTALWSMFSKDKNLGKSGLGLTFCCHHLCGNDANSQGICIVSVEWSPFPITVHLRREIHLGQWFSTGFASGPKLNLVVSVAYASQNII